MQIRVHGPYRHWVLGLLTEIVTFVALLAVGASLALVAARLG